MSAYQNDESVVEAVRKSEGIGQEAELTYHAWSQEYGSILSDLRDKRTVMLFTGGKDSSLILHYLQKASGEFGFSFETHGADYPHNVFTEEEKTRLAAYWQKRGIHVVWHAIPEGDELIEEALINGTNPCYICHKVKRRHLKTFINHVNQNSEKETVIILSYTLWDLVSYSIEYITGSIYADSAASNLFQGKSAEARFTETSQRFYPFIQLDRGHAIFKPLLKYDDVEISQAVKKEAIPLSSVECKYMDYRPKRLMSRYYKQFGMRFNYDAVYAFAEKVLGLRDMTYYRNLDKDQFLEKVI